MLLREGNEALVGGRLREGERLAHEALNRRPGDPAPALLAVAACREQGRAAEAELLLREVLTRHPALEEAQALLGAVLADLGRDAEARRQLDRLVGAEPTPAVAALAAETAASLQSTEHAEALLAPLVAHAPAGAGWHGSVARHLGLLGHVLGRWDEAELHFRIALERNTAAGAPVLVAHTSRQYAALLRARGGAGDWESAIDLLSDAAAVYRRLDIARLADDAEAVLRRSHDPGAESGTAGPNVFSRSGAGWELAFDGQRAVVGSGAVGIHHVADLVAAAGRPVHVVDLVEAGADLTGEYRARLTVLDGQAADAADPLAAALARAEADVLSAELAGAESDAGDTARRLVAFRIRTALDHVDRALPALGDHLRRSVRTGTFCIYEPERPERWNIRR